LPSAAAVDTPFRHFSGEIKVNKAYWKEIKEMVKVRKGKSKFVQM